MPLFLRALPLSLVTLWHYVFVLPLVVIAAIPFMLLTLIPILGLPVLMAIATFITFAGYRCALAAFGKGNEPSFGKLVRASFFWGLVNTLASVVLLVVGFGIGAGLKGISFPYAIELPGLEALPYVTALGAMLYLALVTLFACAVAVPMTDAAHEASAGRGNAVPFFGFGSGSFSLLVVLLGAGYGLSRLGVFETIGAEFAKAMALVVAKYMVVPLEDETSFNWIPLALAVLFLLWTTCWFCATAVLAWDRKHRNYAAARANEVIAQRPRMSAEDLRALRESRMRSDCGPQ